MVFEKTTLVFIFAWHSKYFPNRPALPSAPFVQVVFHGIKELLLSSRVVQVFRGAALDSSQDSSYTKVQQLFSNAARIVPIKNDPRGDNKFVTAKELEIVDKCREDILSAMDSPWSCSTASPPAPPVLQEHVLLIAMFALACVQAILVVIGPDIKDELAPFPEYEWGGKPMPWQDLDESFTEEQVQLCLTLRSM